MVQTVTDQHQSVANLEERIRRIQRLSRWELNDLHFDWEVTCASAIKTSLRDSAEREELFATAYGGLTRILREMRARDGRDLDAPMGCNVGLVEEICGMVGLPPLTMLDVGCSTGLLVQKLLDRGYDAYGIDVSSTLITRAKELAELRFGGHAAMRFLRGNFLRYNFGDQLFDFIHSNDVLEHVHPDEASDFLSKCLQLLRPGGFLWLVTPNRLTGPGDATTIKLPWGTAPVGLHLKEYSLVELVKLLRSVGFAEVHCRLFGTGKARRATKPRACYAHIKRLAEPGFGLLPFMVRRRLMGIFDYSLVVGRHY
jgi:2-polyprenyl-3-methyl-5-hydroxy-6-metoxy-1,4-benzoquinol methylase